MNLEPHLLKLDLNTKNRRGVYPPTERFITRHKFMSQAESRVVFIGKLLINLKRLLEFQCFMDRLWQLLARVVELSKQDEDLLTYNSLYHPSTCLTVVIFPHFSPVQWSGTKVLKTFGGNLVNPFTM
ncbi:CLUMA_CG015940, isoform A [Clunio marinus]|uniref:CLUMA_CG015940, isoform A n=1 Tax=Clunio marinus TaxID=568069 RepID=A0A1J1IQZ0_9DIPT|nr:CLUMA_CG015940, isoform A [Clunio marinus]